MFESDGRYEKRTTIRVILHCGPVAATIARYVGYDEHPTLNVRGKWRRA